MTAIDEQVARDFAATANDILSSLARDETVRREREGGFSRKAWSAAAEAGWFEALLSEEAGGLGLTMGELSPVLQTAGRWLFAGPLAEHAVVAPVLASTADDATREQIAEALAGNTIIALADPAGFGDEGQGNEPVVWDEVLSGSVDAVRFAEQADAFLVVARGPGAPSLLLVPADAPGVAIRNRESLDPTTTIAAVSFDDVACVGMEVGLVTGTAGEAIHELRRGMRLAIAAELAGISAHVLALAVEYAKERKQFGQPIGSFQALQHLIAEAAREDHGLQCLVREATGDQQDARVVKAFAAQVGRSVTEASLQVHGGIAFTEEHVLHLYYKRVLTIEGFHGEASRLWADLGSELLGRRDRAPWPQWY